MSIAAYDPLPGILQLLAGAAVLFALGGTLAWLSLRDLRAAASQRRWSASASEVSGAVCGSVLIVLGLILVLALPTVERRLTVVEVRTQEQSDGGPAKHFVKDTDGRVTPVTAAFAAGLQPGAQFRCRIHRALILDFTLGSCRPS